MERIAKNTNMHINFNPERLQHFHEPVIDTSAIDPNSRRLYTGSRESIQRHRAVRRVRRNSCHPRRPFFPFPAATVAGFVNAGCLHGIYSTRLLESDLHLIPKGDGKMAIRGGYGIFYEHTNGNEGNTESLEGSAPLVLTSAQSNVTGYQNIGAASGPYRSSRLRSYPFRTRHNGRTSSNGT